MFFPLKNKFVRSPKIEYVCLFIILFVTLGAYLPTLHNGFTNWDDPDYVTNNLLIRDITPVHLKAIFSSAVLTTYVPLTILSFALEYHFFGLNPFFYHLHNLLLHGGVILMIFFLLKRMGFPLGVVFTTTLLFAVHPIHVESVAWVSERKDVLYAFFYVWSLYVYWGYLQEKKRKHFILVYVLGILSMLAKPMALSLPLTLLLLDWFYGRREWGRMIGEKLLFFIYIVPITWLTFRYYTQLEPTGGNIFQSCLIYIWTFIFYINKFFWPVDLTLFYVYPQPVSLLQGSYLAAVLIFSGILFLMIYLRNQKEFIFSFLFYFLSIFVVLRTDTRYELNLVADRFMYLSSMGFCLLTALFLNYLLNQWKRREFILVLWLIMGIMAGVLALKTYQQSKIWKDSLTLWNETIRQNPSVSEAYNNRGEAYLSIKEYKLAMVDYDQAIALKSDHIKALNNRGVVYLELKNYDNALSDFNQCITAKPEYVQAYVNRAKVYRDLKKFDLALADIERALVLDPRFFRAYFNRGTIYYDQKKYDLALREFDKALAIDSSYWEAYFNKAIVYKEQGFFDKAVENYRMAIRSNPRLAELYFNLGNLFLLQHDYNLAIQEYDKSLKINSNLAGVYYNRSVAYRAKNNFEEALKDALKAKDLGAENIDNYISEIKERMQ